MKKLPVFLLSFVLIFSAFFVTDGSKTLAASSNGGYVKSTYYAQGGRVNIEYHDLYLKVADARKYAAKSEVSIAEGAAWFGASFIPAAGPYISTIGFYRATEAAVFVSNIRKYTDKNQHVHVTLYKDKFHGTSGRIVTKWDGRKETIKPFKVPAPQYQKVKKTIYK
ncbi:hypothetical protein [Bacillus altitudinis]|uniref:hypothetical protein n=1 Tax=Bacillus altitudinis TaxID=293387 RepID=UPI00071C759F|nr:hypothetical protein [Bacillus altitudinis]KSU65229.1 hypothetical protein AS035_18320 [Bacillus altitudinis]SCC47927.1 hypothetical protein GA0061086_1221 [Bacillus altitudinis]